MQSRFQSDQGGISRVKSTSLPFRDGCGSEKGRYLKFELEEGSCFSNGAFLYLCKFIWEGADKGI